MSFENIIFEVKDRVGKIIINRPPPNIIDIKVVYEMIAAMEELNKGDAKVLIITGAGDKAFSTGVSVQDHLPDKIEETLPLFCKLFRTMASIAQPTIAVVKGYCLGGGSEVACFCDLVIAAEGAQFGQPEIKLGDYAPLGVAAYPKILGRKKSFELLMLGDTITAREAERIGLINKVVAEDQLDDEVAKIVNKFTDLSLVSIKASKRALYAGYDVTFEKALDIAEYIYLNTLAKSKDGMEGLHAFLEKRKPVWKDE